MNPEPTPAPVNPSAPTTPPGWTPLPVEHLPAPTFWPAGVAFAITLLFWGLISSWVILALGGGLLVVSLAGWITDLRHEPEHHA